MTKSIIRKGSRVRGSGLVRHIVGGLKTENIRKARYRLFAGDAGWCPRKSALFSLREGVNTGNAASEFYMSIGTAVHRTIQRALEVSKVMVESERRLDYKIAGVGISGFIDGILNLEDELKILEIKTCGANPPGRPKKEHFRQAMVYALLSGVYEIIILYFSRSVAQWSGELILAEFEVQATQEELKTTAHLLATSVVATKMKIIPDIPAHITSSHDCGFCPFAKLCWGDSPTKFPKVPKAFYDKVDKVENELIAMTKRAHREL